jgi:hypothetical protein
VQVLETLAAAPAPTLESLPASLADSPARAPARDLKSVFYGSRG